MNNGDVMDFEWNIAHKLVYEWEHDQTQRGFSMATFDFVECIGTLGKLIAGK